MKKINWLIALVIVVTIAGCKKNDAGTAAVNEKAVPTATGTPVGTATAKNIGSGGGTVVSADGKVELEIPAGSLSSNTDIAIQAITNNAPNGISKAYRFTPDGLKFTKPISLKMHYTIADAAATISGLMGIAFQDSARIWWRVSNFTNDTVAKIIFAPILHFSDWTIFEHWK